MKLQDLKQNTSNLLVFTKNTLRKLEPSEDALSANIKYWLESGELIQLKKSLYILADTYTSEQNKDEYLEYLASKIVSPAYLSLEYVLAKYQILSEPVRVLTAVTTKSTKDITNKLTTYRYYSISNKLFCGYELKFFKDAPIYEATKSKALFDYLYFRFLKERLVTTQEIENMRLNWENISKKEFEKAKKFLKLTKSKRLKEVFKIIENKYYA